MTLYNQLKADLPQAMKARDKDAVNALRSVIAAIDNAGAVEVDTSVVPMVGRTADVPRRELSETDMRAILKTEAEERHASAVRYDGLGQTEAATQLRAEATIIDWYLNSLSDEQG